MAGVFEVYEASKSAWKWRLRSDQGTVVLTSGGSSWGSTDAAKTAAQAVADAAKGAKVEFN